MIVYMLIGLHTSLSYGQTENYKTGLKAMRANRYQEALTSFNKVVNNEKYEITGKELAMAYAYLATIQTAYMKNHLATIDFESVNKNRGNIRQAINEITRAISFQNSSNKSMIKSSVSTLSTISMRAMKVIADSLIQLDENVPTQQSIYIANLVVDQFMGLENIVSTNWEFHDIIGIAYYHLGNKDLAMENFEKSRKLFSSDEEVQITSQLHLKNYVISSEYYLNEKSDLQKTYKISKEGSAYTSTLIKSLGDQGNMKEVIKLTKVDNKFRSYMDRIDHPEVSQTGGQ